MRALPAEFAETYDKQVTVIVRILLVMHLPSMISNKYWVKG
ncbi:hypothetical protein yberc0001_20500 [Yersinia bercovieri ATCC 43970]|uniref:Uncharacterized protein n=1 Tax=Yersinia bercovieri ATCC 43970 TaxID=349968 RepID=A0ABM9XVZ3_YERBE|nr:hypothetical protein yberc0001_20500 [Yersinia bercovieri ATCC 43970]